MAGWLVLTFAEDENGKQAEEKYKSAGETWLQIATPGYPSNFALGSPGGVVGVEWFEDDPADEDDEGPKLKGKTRQELAEAAEEKAAKEEAVAEPAGAKK